MKRLFLVLFVLLLLVPSTDLQAQAPFYQGKTIRIVTGFATGDVDDQWPRLS